MKIDLRVFQTSQNHLTNWRKIHDRVVDIFTSEIWKVFLFVFSLTVFHIINQVTVKLLQS